MDTLKALNTKEKKRILSMLEVQFAFTGTLDYAFFQSTKNKVYLVTADIGTIPLEGLRIDSIGMYFGEEDKDAIRLSIEGAQLIGSRCEKHVALLDDAQAKTWLAGEDVPLQLERGWWIIRHGEDYLGCGKSNGEKVLNYVPKERRVDINQTSPNFRSEDMN